MRKFTFDIEQTFYKTVVIEAESVTEAEQLLLDTVDTIADGNDDYDAIIINATKSDGIAPLHKPFLASWDSDYCCSRVECDSVNEAKEIIVNAFNNCFGLASEFSASVYKRKDDEISNGDYYIDEFDDCWEEILFTDLVDKIGQELEYHDVSEQ